MQEESKQHIDGKLKFVAEKVYDPREAYKKKG
jgi:hypothetical protein